MYYKVKRRKTMFVVFLSFLTQILPVLNFFHFFLHVFKHFRTSNETPEKQLKTVLLGINSTMLVVIRLCDDILVELLRFANRRQLVKLESLGNRFCYYIGRYFSRSPLLLLDEIYCTNGDVHISFT